jgi:hypothetical protein
MADQDNFITVSAAAGNFEVYFGHQWTGGVEYPQLPLFCLFTDCTRHSMGTEYYRMTIRHIAQFINENGPSGAQTFDHKAVVYDLVTDIDRCPQEFQSPFDDIDCSVDACAEASGIGE